MKKIILAILAFAIVHTISAQSAEQIVEKYIEAKGGAEQLEQISSIKMDGKANANQMEFPFHILMKGKTKFKSYFTFQGNDIVQPAATDGNDVWSTNPMTMENMKLEGDAAEAIRKEALDFPDALLNYAKNGYTVTKGEDADVNGKACYTLTLVKPDALVNGQSVSGQTVFFINKETGLLTKRTQESPMGVLDTYLSDYKEVNGVNFPFHLETKMSGNTINEVEFENIQTNIAINDIEFAYPE
ncbi:hypothetical protein LAG90_03615 [Marinilongibacter aquaticus]|uniref:hypothetical protein n=1 Tax=Marinilongibacter aquaticus TaxID=2975157 RepID=UPI0021BD173F|nr:hypothetical protein [Marinilongibacter aquaticus]UBM59737.1 hypothetical protein LAG90_03615 [Marinilongibacter aquaticus]